MFGWCGPTRSSLAPVIAVCVSSHCCSQSCVPSADRLHALRDAGAFADEERRHRREREMHRTAGIADDRAEHERLVVRVSGHVRQAAARDRGAVEHRLVRVDPFRAEAVDRRIDQAREARVQRVVAEPHLHERGLAVVRQEHVGGFEQPQHRVAGEFGRQIDADRALAPVHRNELRSQRSCRGVVRVTATVPARVAERRLHLDHVGAHVAQVQAGSRTLHGEGHVDDADSRKWLFHRRLPKTGA